MDPHGSYAGWMTITENVSAAPVGALPPMDHARRVIMLRERLAAAELDGVVVTNLTNVRYLCGFTGSAGILVVTDDDLVFLTDGRYTEQCSQEIGASGTGARIEIVAGEPDAAAAENVRRSGAIRIGMEENSLSWAAHTKWNETLLADLQVLPSGSIIEGLRLVKEPAEVVRIRTACEIADRALDAIRSDLVNGPTEIEFAMTLDSTMKRLGAADISFETIVASGPNGAMPHHRPGDRRLIDGDLVVIDFGSLVDGYHSDMTRTIAIGDIGEERRTMFDVVRTAQHAGMEAVAAGVQAAKVDVACREVIADAGWAEAFSHGTGHGVGLDIHEEPRVSSRSDAILEPGHIVTVEPGVYLPGLGGVRIEDTVLVTETGCDRLTRAPKDPEPLLR